MTKLPLGVNVRVAPSSPIEHSRNCGLLICFEFRGAEEKSENELREGMSPRTRTNMPRTAFEKTLALANLWNDDLRSENQVNCGMFAGLEHAGMLAQPIVLGTAGKDSES